MKQKETFFKRFSDVWDKLTDKVANDLANLSAKFIENKLDFDANGNLKPTIANLNNLQAFNLVFQKEYEKLSQGLAEYFVSELKKTNLLTVNYFEDVLKIDINKQTVNDAMNRRLGLTQSGRIKTDGYLGSIVKDRRIMFSVKETIERNISAGKSAHDAQDEIRRQLKGIPKKRKGIVKAQLDTTIKDLFIETDRMTNIDQANKYGLKHFIYGGTLIETSRCFCRKVVGNVFSLDEAEEWRDLIGGDCAPIVGLSGQSIQEKKSNYIPLLDMGGWGCLHFPSFITERRYNRMKSNQENLLD